MGFGINGVETFGSATRELVSKIDLREIGPGDVRWLELAPDRVQWPAVVVRNVFNLRVLLPVIYK